MTDSLADVRADLFSRLQRAARDRRCPMHAPVVVTADVDARVMVLRDFDSASGLLRFHTDTRAPKVGAIADDPRMALLFYDKPAKIQIRARGRGRVETDSPAAEAAWSCSTRFARRCYLGEGPGTVSDIATSGLPAELEGIEPDEAQLVPARPNFAVLLVELEQLDWLYLAHTGHRRARFRREGGAWHGSWLTP